MKVSTQSWHYRLADSISDNLTPSKSLCVYFWQVVWGFIFRFILFPGFIAVVGAVGICGIPAAIGKLTMDLFEFIPKGSNWIVFFWTLGAGYVILLVIFLLMGVFVYWKEIVQPRRSKVVKEDNLFVAYVKAKKRKICPIIEFTGDD